MATIPVCRDCARLALESARQKNKADNLEAENAKLQIELSTLREVRGELERNNGHLHEELFRAQNENANLKSKLAETEALLNAALTGQVNCMAEAEELRKKLECPPVTFDESYSSHPAISFYYQKDTDGVWRASPRLTLPFLSNLSAQSESDIKRKIESYSNELWNKLHEVKP